METPNISQLETDSKQVTGAERLPENSSWIASSDNEGARTAATTAGRHPPH